MDRFTGSKSDCHIPEPLQRKGTVVQSALTVRQILLPGLNRKWCCLDNTFKQKKMHAFHVTRVHILKVTKSS
jgi:hypothetical protein